MPFLFVIFGRQKWTNGSEYSAGPESSGAGPGKARVSPAGNSVVRADRPVEISAEKNLTPQSYNGADSDRQMDNRLISSLLSYHLVWVFFFVSTCLLGHSFRWLASISPRLSPPQDLQGQPLTHIRSCAPMTC